MLNSDLESDSIEIPAFVPLKELDAHVEIPIRGYYVHCTSCQRELRINARFAGRKVTCKHCQGGFRFRPEDPVQSENLSYYVNCPHCSERLRMSRRYLDTKVVCKSCKGQLVVKSDVTAGPAPSES